MWSPSSSARRETVLINKFIIVCREGFWQAGRVLGKEGGFWQGGGGLFANRESLKQYALDV